MAVAVPTRARQKELFFSIFPRPNFTTPTPESTPNIGTISSPGISFGGFNAPSNDVGETGIFNRAWSTATRYLALTANDNGKTASISGDVLNAFSYLLQSPAYAKDLSSWFKHETGTHFRTFILPELSIWEQPVPVSRADDVLRLTLDFLIRAQQHYFSRLDELTTLSRGTGLYSWATKFHEQSLRSLHVLVLQLLPRERLQKTLTSVIYQHLVLSLERSANSEKFAKDQTCSCRVNFDGLPLAAIHETGLGGVFGERAFAYAIDRFLRGPAIERRCFAVDWSEQSSVVPKLRTWMASEVVPQVERALAAITGRRDFQLAPNEANQLSSIAVNNLGRKRASSLFDYIKLWPDSKGAVQDIWEHLSAGAAADKVHVCHTFTEQIERRLLHAGATTAEILSIYVNMIHAFKALDGRGVLLEKVAGPTRSYLRSREDTVSIIAASFLLETDESGKLVAAGEDKVCIDMAVEISNASSAGRGQVQSLNWDDMEWMPDPIDAGPNYSASKSEDILAQVLSLFEQEEFIKEVTIVLAQHLLHTTDAHYLKETRLIELLKTRLDASKLQAAEVMLKDVRDAVALGRRINPDANYESSTAVPTPKEIQAAIPEDGITLQSLYSLFSRRISRGQFMAVVKLVANRRGDLFFAKRTRLPPGSTGGADQRGTVNFKTQILSSFFWPQLRSNEFALPRSLEPLQTTFEQKFDALGTQRRLQFRPALSRASLKLELEDRVVEEFDVPAWRVSVIDAFASQSQEDNVLSAEELTKSLQMEEELVIDALSFWSGKRVLYQRTPGRYAVLERLDMEVGDQQSMQQHDDLVSAMKSQDAMLREGAPVFEQFIANMLRNQGSKEITGMMGITNLMKMVLPSFTYGDEEVLWLLGEMEKRGEVTQNDGGSWRIAK